MKALTLIIFIVLTLYCPAWSAAESPVPDAPTPEPAGPDSPAMQMTDIHDIKPPVDVATARRWIYYAAGAASLLILALAAGWYWYKKRRAIQRESPVRPSLPEETARRMLNRLSDFKRMPGREFYYQLSIILRRYIEERFRVGAPEMTTEEFLPRIEKLNLDQELEMQLKRLLRDADPIKFAGAPAMESRMAADLDFAHRFVDRTTTAVHAAESEANANK